MGLALLGMVTFLIGRVLLHLANIDSFRGLGPILGGWAYLNLLQRVLGQAPRENQAVPSPDGAAGP